MRRETSRSETVEKMGDVIPIGVHCLDQIDLPLPGPVLDRFLARDSIRDEVVLLEPDQCFHAVFRCKTRRQVVLVLIQTAGQVAGHAGVERTIALRCKDIDIAFSHAAMIAWDGVARKSIASEQRGDCTRFAWE